MVGDHRVAEIQTPCQVVGGFEPLRWHAPQCKFTTPRPVGGSSPGPCHRRGSNPPTICHDVWISANERPAGGLTWGQDSACVPGSRWRVNLPWAIKLKNTTFSPAMNPGSPPACRACILPHSKKRRSGARGYGVLVRDFLRNDCLPRTGVEASRAERHC